MCLVIPGFLGCDCGTVAAGCGRWEWSFFFGSGVFFLSRVFFGSGDRGVVGRFPRGPSLWMYYVIVIISFYLISAEPCQTFSRSRVESCITFCSNFFIHSLPQVIC